MINYVYYIYVMNIIYIINSIVNKPLYFLTNSYQIIIIIRKFILIEIDKYKNQDNKLYKRDVYKNCVRNWENIDF